MSSFYLRVIASNRTFFKGKVEKLTLPTVDGEKGVLAHHENMFIAVSMGDLRYTTEDGVTTDVVVGDGYAQIVNNRATVLVDTAELPEEIDAKRAQEALERAQERLRQQQSAQEYHHSQAAMARAMTRLKLQKKFM